MSSATHPPVFGVHTCLLMCVLVTSPAQAFNFTWNSQTGGSFHSAANWTPPFLGPPDILNDTAIFALGGTFITTFANDVTNGQLVMGAASGTVSLDLNGHTYTLSGPAAGSLFVGQAAGDNAGLVLTDGLVVTDDSISVADVIGSQGAFNVSAGATLSQTSGTLFVGLNGRGSMQVTQGGVANTRSVIVGHTSHGIGTLNVSGANSQLDAFGPLSVGNSGNGDMLISQQGIVEAQQIVLGSSAGGDGVVSVDGANSLLRSVTFLHLGDGASSQAHLDVRAGGRVNVGSNVRVGGNTTGTRHYRSRWPEFSSRTNRS